MNFEERIKFYEEHYDIAYSNILTEKTLLGSEGACRYCSKSIPEVTFNKKAHALPELIGNKLLFSKDECDSCNEWFSSNGESDLANFLGIGRTASQIKGKKGVPKFVSKDHKSSIKKEDGIMKYVTREDSESFEIDHEQKSITIKSIKQAYNPRNVFKCITKLALAVMEERDIGKFKATKEWLISNDFEDRFNGKLMKCFYGFTGGMKPFDKIAIMLFRRKDISANVHHMTFYVAFSNYSFQINILGSKKDQCKDGCNLKFIPFPNPFEMEDSNATTYRILELGQNSLVKEQEDKMVMGFDKMIKLSPEEIEKIKPN